MPNHLTKPQTIPKIQVAQRQVSEYQEGGMPFGLGDGARLKLSSNFTDRVSGIIGLRFISLSVVVWLTEDFDGAIA